MDETRRLVRLAKQRQANLLEGFDGVCIAQREGKPMFVARQKTAIDPVEVDALNIDGGVCPALNAECCEVVCCSKVPAPFERISCQILALQDDAETTAGLTVGYGLFG